jgi:hypothetical protein
MESLKSAPGLRNEPRKVLKIIRRVIRICKTIKTLILEIIHGEGPSHIQEIHLRVTEFRPEVPQHTIRARLSEMSRSEDLEEKLNAYGNGFYSLYEENLDLCSVVSYPERGPWGDPQYRGNCSGWLAKDLILRFKIQSIFDPAEGSGTIRDVVNGINVHKQTSIHYEGRDLTQGWDVLTGPMPEKQFDMVWYHPPYWDIIRYSNEQKDLSNCATLEEFENKLNRSAERLIGALKPGGIMAILIGDKRKNGIYYPLLRTLLINPKVGELRAIITKVQHHCQSDKKDYRTNNPFLIPIKHEYCLIYQKQRARA